MRANRHRSMSGSGSGGETGRREGLKIPWAKAHAGSIPAPSITRWTMAVRVYRE